MGAETLIFRIRTNLGTVYSRTGRVPEALLEYERGEDSLEPNTRRQARNNRAVALGAYLGRYDEALELYETCRQEAADASSFNSLLLYLRNLNAYRRVGKYDLACNRQIEAIALARRLDDGAAEATSLSYLGLTLLIARRNDQALSVLAEARQLLGALESKGIERPGIVADVLSSQALGLLLEGDIRSANVASARAYSIHREKGNSGNKDVGTAEITYGITLLALRHGTGRNIRRTSDIFKSSSLAAMAEPTEYWAPKYDYALSELGLASTQVLPHPENETQSVVEAFAQALHSCSLIGVREQALLYVEAVDRYAPSALAKRCRALLTA